MAGTVNPDQRDYIQRTFRAALMSRMGITPFVHQAKWYGASDGIELHEGVVQDGGVPVQLPSGEVQSWAFSARQGGHARFIADLGSFKIGKSYGAAVWLAGFAAVPDARVSLVGLEYAICEPEFNYLCEFLLSDRGMGLKYQSLQNRPNDGRMWLELTNGARFEAKSWERKESLKGKEIDAYCFCEAYQLPGIECFTANSQNLRARRGYAIFPTTPDRPWVQQLHDRGHGQIQENGQPDYTFHCTCGVSADVNPFTYDASAKERDRSLMTREKFAIHYEGKLGDYVGRVFQYQRGERVIGPDTTPELFQDGRRVVPDGWEVVHGADTGTYYSALSVAFSPEGHAYVLAEYPNYRYVGGLPERDESITIPEWSGHVRRRVEQLDSRPVFWADKNSQFKHELKNYGLALLPSVVPRETRTEITREYFQNGRIWLDPGLTVLPFELENAQWPEEATAGGKFERIKDRDHTLDCLEHVLSRRPSGKIPQKAKSDGNWIKGFVRENRTKQERGNRHLGRF